MLRATQAIVSKVKDKLLYFALSTTTKKTECLVGLFGFWKLPTLKLGILLQPITKWCKRLAALSGPQSRKGLSSRARLECKPPAIWIVPHGRRWVFEVSVVGEDAMSNFCQASVGEVQHRLLGVLAQE